MIIHNRTLKNSNLRSVTAVVVSFLLTTIAYAEPFTYQGQLTDNNVPANGLYDMIFRLTDTEVGGLALAIDSVNNVEVIDGLFTVEVDFPSTLLNASNRWMSISVEGTSLSPRVRLRDTPRAQNAVRANTAGTLETPLFVTDSSSAAIITSGNTSTGQNASGLLGRITSTSPGGVSAGVRGENNGTGFGGMGLYGSHGGFGYGAYGTSPGGVGVFGNTDIGFGLWGQSDANTGVYARTNSGPQALQALNSDADSEAFLATNNFGVHGLNLDPAFFTGGIGVRGEGGRIGVQGFADTFVENDALIGVHGHAGSDTNGADRIYGVFGAGRASVNDRTIIRTVYGVYGVAHTSFLSDFGYGIYGATSGDGGILSANSFAGYFDGDVHVAGTLSKSSGSFKIDHPLDPENKYLSHSFVESPDMMNIYNGIIMLDQSGTGVVELPDYFETLNRDFRYQLTAIGASMPGLYISSEVSTNSFAIAGGVPNARVSWEITGVRQDPAALHHPIIVEQEKPEQHKGKYLNPKAYGFGDDAAIHQAQSQN
ncbi:MAG: hypothetical protein P1U42_03640 [Phycisphaerales bacterium]|nr:hypothetical protein [Phycisphaerales bacterium]